jgi:hypothetical protein
MPTIPCKVSITCPGSDSPISNFSSESPDVIDFGAMGFPIVFPDNPLGPDAGTDPIAPAWWALGCVAPCFSTVSQDAANECAAAQAYECSRTPPRPGPRPPVFFNAQQQCQFPCPDGTVFIWTVLAGSVVAGSQALADRIAEEIACTLAAVRHFCLPALQQSCVNQPFSQTIFIGTGVAPFSFSIALGILPPGIGLTQVDSRTAILSGTPTMAGAYPFVMSVADEAGNTVSKQYVFNVMGCTNPTALPQASQGTAYSQMLTAVGGIAPFTFTLELGELPPGLTLGSDGTISGIPTLTGDFAFTVGIIDSGTNFCSQNFTLHVAAGCPDWIDTINTGPFPDGILGGGSTFAPTQNIAIRKDRVFISRLASIGWIEDITFVGSTPTAGGDQPYDMAYSPITNKVYVSMLSGGAAVYVQTVNADTGALVTTFGGLALANTYNFLRYVASKDRIYCVNTDGTHGNLIVINPNTPAVTNTVSLVLSNTSTLNGVDYCPTNNLGIGSLYVGVYNSVASTGSVIVLDANTFAVLTTINLGNAGVIDVLYSPDADRIFVSTQNFVTNAVAIIVIKPSNNTVESTIALDSSGGTGRMGYNTVTKRINVETTAGVHYIIDATTSKIVCTLAPKGLTAIAQQACFSTFNQKIYEAATGTQTCFTLK